MVLCCVAIFLWESYSLFVLLFFNCFRSQIPIINISATVPFWLVWRKLFGLIRLVKRDDFLFFLKNL